MVPHVCHTQDQTAVAIYLSKGITQQRCHCITDDPWINLHKRFLNPPPFTAVRKCCGMRPCCLTPRAGAAAHAQELVNGKSIVVPAHLHTILMHPLQMGVWIFLIRQKTETPSDTHSMILQRCGRRHEYSGQLQLLRDIGEEFRDGTTAAELVMRA